MPTLNWIGKEAVVDHDKEVPFRLLRKVKSASVGENSENLIIHGDNLEALKALMPHYQGRVKCIYIDPPYNTGNEGWVYNDKVNSPKIKKWLGKVVGAESEDLCRHDKWLCMMYPRLKMLRELLSEDGVIFISIDDNEQGNLKVIMDEIFGEENFITQYIWEARGGRDHTAVHASISHEYILCFSKNIAQLEMRKDERISTGGNYSDEKGNYRREQLRQWGTHDTRKDRPTMFYPIIAPDGKKILPIKDDGTEGCWRISEGRMQKMIAENDVEFVRDGTNWRAYAKKRDGKKTKTAYGTMLQGVGTSATGTIEIKSLFNEKAFNTTKPIELIKYLIRLISKKDSIILDSFAGSGTTAHAVLDLNKEDGGNRKFILIEMEDKVAKDITAERVKRAIKKYEYDAGFEFCELGKPLFDERGSIDEECTFEDLATYLFFTETDTNIDKNAIDHNKIGEHNGTHYYLIYKGKGKNTFTKETLKKIDSPAVVYADKCLVDGRTLEKHHITFKQIPYEIRVY